MVNKIMTQQRQVDAKRLYMSTPRPTVSEIARRIGVSQATLSHWINQQSWYVRVKPPAELRKGGERLPYWTFDPGDAYQVNNRSDPTSFVIPWRLPGMNEMISQALTNKYHYGNYKKKTQEDIAACIAAGTDTPKPYPVRIHLEICFVEKDRKRDYDNVAAGQKLILDAMQDVGIIANDDPVHVAPSIITYDVDEQHPRVEVRIVPHFDEPLPVGEPEPKPKPSKSAATRTAKPSAWPYPMTAGEIVRSYVQAKNREAQIGILADLNATTKSAIRKIIAEEASKR